jgi:hypothetical protein
LLSRIFGYGMAFFGMLGSHNDINFLHRYLLFDKLIEGSAPAVNNIVNGHDYTMGYDGLLSK